MKSLSRLSLSVAFLLTFALAALPMLAGASAEPWPSAPVTITDANADFDLVAFGWHPAVEHMALPATSMPRYASFQRQHADTAGSLRTVRLGAAPFDAVADWRAKRRLWA